MVAWRNDRRKGYRLKKEGVSINNIRHPMGKRATKEVEGR